VGGLRGVALLFKYFPWLEVENTKWFILKQWLVKK